MKTSYLYALLLCLTLSGLKASSYRGTVMTSGLPVPGAAIAAAQGTKKVVTTTDERGAFAFADLADGVWTIEVEALGFAKLSREVGIAPDAPAPAFEMKFLSEEALLATLEPSAPAAKAASLPAPAEIPKPAAARPAPNTPRQPLPSLTQRGGFQRDGGHSIGG